MEADTGAGAQGRPDLSLVVPCYNEEDVVEYTVDRLLRAFDDASIELQLVLVNNGSRDRTASVLEDLEGKYAAVAVRTVDVNQGYGYGILTGIPACEGRWVGSIPADGQVDAEDVVRLFQAADSTDGLVLAKVRRRFRMDGLKRKVVSTFYNVFFRTLWPTVSSLDINGTPKILPREQLLAMDLQSTDWCLDPEIMVKAHNMGLRVLELNAFARMRGGGISHVRASTAWNFFTRLIAARLGGQWQCDPLPAAASAERIGPPPNELRGAGS